MPMIESLSESGKMLSSDEVEANPSEVYFKQGAGTWTFFGERELYPQFAIQDKQYENLYLVIPEAGADYDLVFHSRPEGFCREFHNEHEGMHSTSSAAQYFNFIC